VAALPRLLLGSHVRSEGESYPAHLTKNSLRPEVPSRAGRDASKRSASNTSSDDISCDARFDPGFKEVRVQPPTRATG
jgi:hypothetical protein